MQRQEAELQPLLDQQLAGNVQTHLSPILVGRPAGSGGGSWRLPVLVPLGAGARLAGYYGAIIDLGYFLARYRDVELGQAGSNEIVHEHGFMLAALRGGILADTALQMPLSDSPAGYGTQLPMHSSLAPGNDRLLHLVRKLPRYPILVAVTQDPDEVFGKLAGQHRSYWIRSIIYSAAVLAVTAGLLVSLRQQRRLQHAAAQSEQETLKLIDLLEQEKARALALASHDYLTGIPNRRMFHELASSELKRARRSKNMYALLFFDLDRFKLVNDTLGHAVGDLLLKAVAKRLRDNLREYDLVARLGGDEFVVLLSEIKVEASVAQLAAKLVRELSKVYPDLNGHDVETSPSIGIALYQRDGQTIEELLTLADHAMYNAKAKGRGRFSFYDASLNASSARRTARR
jgi:diguanylate cyclase (GGDEF)-like protein